MSFSGELYRLRRELNLKIDLPDTIAPAPRSHPLGVARRFKRRRITIAEAYLMVVKDLDSGHFKSRLRALRMLVDASFHAKTLDLPLNTARVQMALMKEAIKNRNNLRKQLELLHDFSVSSHGQHQVIRKLCRELNIIELPETGEKLKDLGMGWDLHVHDTATSGRKNATQLLIDAFIKGISELTIAYGSAASVDMMEEAVEAGRIVGIKVNLGLEFSLYFANRRYHFMALLPEIQRGDELKKFLKSRHRTLKDFLDGLERNQSNRIESVEKFLDNFNKTDLREINSGFPDDELYRLRKLKMKDLESFISLSSVNRMHLGEFLFIHYRPILFNRLMYLKVQRDKAQHDLRRKAISEWDFGIIDEKYARLRKEYRELNPDSLRKRYFVNPNVGDYATVFDDLPEVHRQLEAAGCRLKVLHPLEHGLERAMKLLDKNRGLIDQVEIYNMQDNIHRDPDEIQRLCRQVNDLNRQSAAEGQPTFVPVCGSDATGRSPEIPGMGFVRADRLAGWSGASYRRRHIALPGFVSQLVLAGGAPVDPAEAGRSPAVICMGKISGGALNRLADEPGERTEAVKLSRALRYLNPYLLNLVHMTIGFLVANAFIGLTYACVWLGITGVRNMIADIVSSRGTRVSDWNMRSVNFNNVARSMFWTGFSVPILGFVKAAFDSAWPFEPEGLLFNFVKFFLIAFANGTYIALHNSLRGFDRKVIRANFFRTLISWPFASLFAPFGNLAGIPSIVQSKFWSDVVAGFVEGGLKYLKLLRLRRRDLEEIVPRILTGGQDERNTAILDLMYLYREEPRTRTSLRDILVSSGPDSFGELAGIARDDGLYRDLVDFILVQYTNEVAFDLVSLVSGTLPGLRDWLSQQARLTPAPRRPEPPPDGEEQGRPAEEAAGEAKLPLPLV